MSVTITGLWANELRVRGGAPVSEAGQVITYWGAGHQAARLPGRRGHQAGKVARPSCAGWVGCQAGNVNRQARPVRSSCAGERGGLPGRQGRQAGKAGLVVMCWGGGGGEQGAWQARSPGRQGHPAGEAGQASMCWVGGVSGRQGCQAGKVTMQARPVRPSCAGGGGVPGRQGRQADEAARQARPVRASYAGGGGAPIRRGRSGSGHHVLGGWRASQARPTGHHMHC